MILFYWFLVLSNFVLILVKCTRINFIDLYFFSSVFYYLNALFGNIYSLFSLRFPIPIEINTNTYIVLCLNQLLIFVFQFFPRKKIKKINYESNSFEVSAYKVCSMILFFLAVYYTLDLNLFTRVDFDKKEMLDSASSFESYFKYGSFYFGVMGLLFWKKLSRCWKILIIYPIFVTFLMGHRSFLVMLIIASFFIYLDLNNSKYSCLLELLNKNKIIILLGTIFVAFVYIIKNLSTSLFIGNYALVKERLMSSDFYLNSFKMSESNIILNHINNTIINNFSLPKNTYIPVLSLLIPVVGRLINVDSFNSYMQNEFYSNFESGTLGSSFIAEAFANGGLFLVFIIISTVLIISLTMFNYFSKSKYSIPIRTMCLCIGVEAGFYIHRNSLYTFFVRIRVYFYFTLLFLFILFICRAIFNTPKRGVQ